METGPDEGREARAARNEAVFRSLNEKIASLHESLETLRDTFGISCECANRRCVEMIDIRPREYKALRADSRHFAVRPHHVCADVETVVHATGRYVVVEKTGIGGEVAEQLDARRHDG